MGEQLFVAPPRFFEAYGPEGTALAQRAALSRSLSVCLYIRMYVSLSNVICSGAGGANAAATAASGERLHSLW
jgi:hypothetical protein